LGTDASFWPSEVRITDALEPGENVLAIRIDHRRITELFLAGIIRSIPLMAESSPTNLSGLRDGEW
jgi:hypothetical protein